MPCTFRKWKINQPTPPPGFALSKGNDSKLVDELRRANEQSRREQRAFRKWWQEQQSLQEQQKQQQLLQEQTLQQQMAMQTECLKELLLKTQIGKASTPVAASLNDEAPAQGCGSAETLAISERKGKHIPGRNLSKGLGSTRKSSRVTSESISHQLDGNATDGERDSELDDVVADRDYLPETSEEESDDCSSVFTTANEEAEVQSLMAEAGPSSASFNFKTRTLTNCPVKDCGKSANHIYLDEIFEQAQETSQNDAALRKRPLQSKKPTGRPTDPRVSVHLAKDKSYEATVAKRIAEMQQSQASLPKFVSPVRGSTLDEDDPSDYSWVTQFDLQVDSGPLDFFRIPATFDECHEAYLRFLSKLLLCARSFYLQQKAN